MIGQALSVIAVIAVIAVNGLATTLSLNGQPLAPEVWAILMLFAGMVISAAVALTRRDLAYLLVIVWAYVGVSVKQSATPSVSFFALAMAAVVLALAVQRLIRRRGSAVVAG